MYVLTRHRIVLLSAILALIAFQAIAQPYPSKPIRVISPIPPGSGTDLALRAAAQQLQSRMGQPWIVENRPGANYIAAAEACAKAPPDGYTICFFSGTVTSFNPYTFTKLPYDSEQDFKPITRMFYLVNGLIATSSLPANSVKELQALATSKAGELNFGTLGPGSNPDVFRQWLGSQWKTDIVAIPYNGGPPIVRALMAGDIHLSTIGLGSLGGQLKTGKMKVLALEGSSRSPLLPDVPTYAEAGIDGYPLKSWWGLLAPAGVPDSIVSRLNTEIITVFRDAKFIDYLNSQFLQPAVLSTEEFGSFMKSDREYTALLFKKFNVLRQ